MSTGNHDSRLIHIFLCCAAGDKQLVRPLYELLEDDGVQAWVDEKALANDQIGYRDTTLAVSGADVCIICLSDASAGDEAYLQKVTRNVLGAFDESTALIKIVPVRLEACEIPLSLRRLPWINFYDASGYEQLEAAFAERLSLFVRPAGAAARPAPASPDEDDLQLTFAVPIVVIVSPELTPLIDPTTITGQLCRAELRKVRSMIYYDLGVLLPRILLSGDAPLGANQYYIALKEVPAAHGAIRPDGLYVNDSAENIRVFGLEAEDVSEPAELKPGAWIPAEQRLVADLAGLRVWEPMEVIMLHLSRVLSRCAHEFVGIQEAHNLLDFVSRGAPQLVEEVLKVVPLHQITTVLQRLVEEGISIRDVKSILEAISVWGRTESDVVLLTEYVRTSLKRYIGFRYTGGRRTLHAVMLDSTIEELIKGAIRQSSTGSFLSLAPALAGRILAAVRSALSPLLGTSYNPVVITELELRRFVRKMIELEFPRVAVLSYHELTPEINVQPIARVVLDESAIPPPEEIDGVQ